jgi:glyoxylase-like metal-dependent hydrolase (beta-lactamase superfamily II)
VSRAEVIPVPLGLFSVEGREISKYPGVRIRAPYVVSAYLILHPDARVLFDSGIVADSGAVSRHGPRHFSIVDQLGALGLKCEDIDVVVNCHLHADHAGGNHLFTNTPIVVQSAELAASREVDYTISAACVDFPGADFHVIDGRQEILQGIIAVPTPGHSPGHQALIVEGGSDGTVALMGQAFDSASEFALAHLAYSLRNDLAGDVETPAWMAEFMDVDLALFAHDLAQWRPREAGYSGSSALDVWV